MSDELEDLRRRIDLLEEENQRLREKIEPIFGPDNPSFDVVKFRRALGKNLALLMLPLYLVAFIQPVTLLVRRSLGPISLGPIPLFDPGGIGTRHPGIGLGAVAFGGAAFGFVAVGGLGVGVIAMGGGGIGIIAMGGGALGIVAIGGGACGLVAIGGAAYGYYALGQRGAGKFVLALNRQDDEAIAVFSRWFPGIRAAVTRPMRVIPLTDKAHGSPSAGL